MTSAGHCSSGLISPYITDTVTITTDNDTLNDTGFSLTDNSFTINTTVDASISVGNTRLDENRLKDLMVLLDIIDELEDDNPIKALFDSKKMLNKMKVNNE